MPTIGIDLGTTFSAVAYVDDHGMPKVIPNAMGARTTPSVVYFEDGGGIVVGCRERRARRRLLRLSGNGGRRAGCGLAARPYRFPRRPGGCRPADALRMGRCEEELGRCEKECRMRQHQP